MPEFEALLRFRLTCRALRDRIDDEWGHVQWNIVWVEDVPDALSNGRGVAIPSDSPCLRLAKVVDLMDPDGFLESRQIPTYLRPEIITFDNGSYPMTAHAKTLIAYGYCDVGLLSCCACRPISGHANVIFPLHCPPPCPNAPESFEDVGNVSWSADVYLLLSGCGVLSGAVEDLCEAVMASLTGKDSVIEGDKVQFYFVDVPSWFDPGCTRVSSDNPNRLDHILTSFHTFYGYLLECANPWQSQESSDYRNWWPSPMVLKRLSQVHSITRQEMRARVGDKAYELAIAPRASYAP